MQEEHIGIARLMAKFPSFNDEEQALWDEWIAKGNNQEIWDSIYQQDKILSELEIIERLAGKIPSSRKKLEQKIGVIPISKGATVSQIRKYLSAAAVVGIITITGYLFLNRKPTRTEKANEEKVAIQPAPIEPGKYKARLTLADGSTIFLDKGVSGKLASQGSTEVVNDDGKLLYQHKENTSDAPVFNTLATANGETYELTLSDGSKVWLNAGSSVRFPVAFTGPDRRIEITGEAFLEVAKNPQKPFITKVGNSEIKVLGTVFNVNGYTNEGSIQTTLLEGKVQVSAGGYSTIITPGEQAQYKNNGTIQVEHNADIEKVTAWKNGLFIFRNDDLRMVMHQLERWYNVKVTYKGQIPDKQLIGIIGRDQPLKDVLKALEMNNVHATVEGNEIIVTP
jgi:ferric-dicitrate binding protein FerR (iron transport regulator)